MQNKSTIKGNTKNSVFTPKQVKLAFENLPYNYVMPVQDLLQAKVDSGEIKKNYSGEWIKKVKKGEYFNEDIVDALVKVGLENHEKRKVLGLIKKKTPSTSV